MKHMARKDFDYGKQVTELEQVVAALQEPTVQLDEAIKLHATGLKLIEELEDYLSQVDAVVKKRTIEVE
jgi:exodeoxyribonuclease VII small subunit